MSLKKLTPAAAILALAACQDNQTAQAPTPPTAPGQVRASSESTATTADTATDRRRTPVGDASSDAPSMPTTANTNTTGTVPQTSPAPPATGATDPAHTAAIQPPSGLATGSQSELKPFQGRSLEAGQLAITLRPDGTFAMRETGGGREVEGRYAFENGILTFSEPRGDLGDAAFPMQCRFEANGDELRLADMAGSCSRFKDLVFKATG